MKIKLEVPKQEAKVSIEADLDEEKVKKGIAKLYRFIKKKLPFKLEVSKGGDQSQHQD